ncbi:MAG: hypothetical protein ABSA33_05750 [Candidatus Micrarchaeaceae archaeon]
MERERVGDVHMGKRSFDWSRFIFLESSSILIVVFLTLLIMPNGHRRLYFELQGGYFVLLSGLSVLWALWPKKTKLSSSGLNLSGTTIGTSGYKVLMIWFLLMAVGSAVLLLMFLFEHHDLKTKLIAGLLLFNIPVPWVFSLVGTLSLRNGIRRSGLSSDSQVIILRKAEAFSVVVLAFVYITIFLETAQLYSCWK